MRFLFLSFNLGGYFDHPNPENFEKSWMECLGQIARASQIPFIAIHFQELGGKKKKVELIDSLAGVLEKKIVDEGYWSSRLIASFDVQGEFTALGVIMFINKKYLSDVEMWNFAEQKFVSASLTSTCTPSELFEKYCEHKRIAFGPEKSRKGLLRTRWSIKGVSNILNLVNVHLVHDESNITATVDTFPSGYATKRIRAMNAIYSSMLSQDPTALLFIFGDFNVRLDLHRFVPWIAHMEDRRRKKAEIDSTANSLKKWMHINKGASPRLGRRGTIISATDFKDMYGQSFDLRDQFVNISVQSLKTTMKNFEGLNVGWSSSKSGGMKEDYKLMLLFGMLSIASSPSSTNLQKKREKRRTISMFGRSLSMPMGLKPKTRKKSSRSAIVTKFKDLSPEQVQVYRDVFNFIDANHDGTLSAAELSQALRSSDLEFSDQDMKKIIQIVDFDQSGDMDFTEFLAMMTKKNTDMQSKVETNNIFLENTNDELNAFPTVEAEVTQAVATTNIQQEPFADVPNKESSTVGVLKAVKDKLGSIQLKEKKFIFEQKDLLGRSTDFRLLVKHFDNELGLFNDCRKELNLPPLYEMDIAFPPTYPLLKDSTSKLMEYSDSRCPSWVDRVVMNQLASENILAHALSKSEDLAELEVLLKTLPVQLLGLDRQKPLTETCGNFYSAFFPNTFVSDHCAVVLGVNLG